MDSERSPLSPGLDSSGGLVMLVPVLPSVSQMTPAVRNALHIGSSFCCVFMAFSVSQNFQTSSDHKSAGANALGILYACFTFSNFVAAFVVSTFGAKKCLIAGALSYVAFVAANIQYYMPTLYMFSGLLGCGAAILWTAQGAYISNCAVMHEQQLGLPPSSTLGFFNGLFFAIFQTNQLLGNLLAAILFKLNVDTFYIFVVMTCIAGVGWLTLLFLASPAKAVYAQPGEVSAQSSFVGNPYEGAEGQSRAVALSSSLSYGDAALGHPAGSDGSSGGGGVPSDAYLVALHGTVNASPLQKLLQVFDSLRLLADPRLLMMIPIMVFSGLSQTYFFGDFPPLIEDRATKFFVLAAMGATDALASVVMGKLSDLYGRVLVLALGFATAGAAIVFLYVWQVDQQAVYVFYLVGITMAVSDGVYNTQIYAILGTFFESKSEQAFANFKLFQAGSTAVAFLLNDVIGFQWKCVLTGGALVAGTACLAAYDLAHRASGARGSVLDGAGPKGQAAADSYDHASPEAHSPLVHSQSPSAATLGSLNHRGGASAHSNSVYDAPVSVPGGYHPPAHTAQES